MNEIVTIAFLVCLWIAWQCAGVAWTEPWMNKWIYAVLRRFTTHREALIWTVALVATCLMIPSYYHPALGMPIAMIAAFIRFVKELMKLPVKEDTTDKS